jgi:hypothetical protein
MGPNTILTVYGRQVGETLTWRPFEFLIPEFPILATENYHLSLAKAGRIQLALQATIRIRRCR